MLVFHNGILIITMLFELAQKQILLSVKHIQCQYSQEFAN